MLIDGTGKKAIENSTVIVENEKIIYAGKIQKDIQDCEIINIEGKTIMPGLIDAHLHFSGNLSDNDSDWVMEPNTQKAIMASVQAKECLDGGLTTVGEISRFGINIRDMIEEGLICGPRVVASGVGFCATASHGDSHHCTKEQNETSHPWAKCVDGPWDLRKAIRERLRDNPDAIKIWVTGGGIWRWDTSVHQHYSYEEVEAAVNECHLREVPLWAHCMGSAYNSVKAGADFIIHGTYLDDETLDMMAKKNIALCPTINFLPDWYKVYPVPYVPELHDKYDGETVYEKELNRTYDNLKRAKAKGILLTIGSDSFCSSLTPFAKTTMGEIIDFVEKAEISNMDTICAATLNGAKALKVDDITGSLEKGKFADLIVLNGDPLKNIRCMNCEDLKIVMKQGYIYKNTL